MSAAEKYTQQKPIELEFDPGNISDLNPMGTDGFEFVEYAEPAGGAVLVDLMNKLGFTAVAKHKTKNVTLYRQGQVSFIINSEPDSHAAEYAKEHGPSACAMAFRVVDAEHAFNRAVELGATPYEQKTGPGENKIPAILGIGGSLLYFVDKYGDSNIYEDDFDFITEDKNPVGNGLEIIDHLTHNVYKGNMDEWAGYYEKLFNFKEQRYFDIDGSKTGLISRAMIAPCGLVRIPINEAKDQKSQIQEYLDEYKGEGIQHIALTSENIVESVSGLRSNGVPFMEVPDTYYDVIGERLPGHGLDLDPLKKENILVDGVTEDGPVRLLLQIFTNVVIGPIFFEVIQRKGHNGFGEGNFSALFEAIERDQMRRGYL